MSIGSRIPDPYFGMIRNRAISRRYIRRCRDCGFEHPTAEIPLHVQWKGGKADRCPVHTDLVGRTVNSISVRMARTGRYNSPGLLRVISAGGYYRRRECRKPDCMDPNGKRTRWTTGEFSPDGTIVGDIMICPRCGGRSLVPRRLLLRYEEP